MDLRKLRYFVGVVDAGSFSRAAAKLNVAQSAISHHLTSLEAELKTRLLIRGPGGVVLTDAGSVLYRHAQAILRQVEIATADAMSAKSLPSGRASIGLPSVLSPLLGYPLLRAVCDRYPDIRLTLVEGVSAILREFVQNGRVDVALLFISERYRGIDVHPLLHEELFYLSATRPEHRIVWSEIFKTPMLLPGRESGIKRVIEAALETVGATLGDLHEIDSIATLKKAVAAGMGGTVLPWSATYGDSEGAGYVLSPFEPEPVTRPISFCFPEVRGRSIAVEAVVDVLKDVVDELVQAGHWPSARFAHDGRKP
jgi:LysR family nitrogen assimilation transcriptional regulator